MNLRFHPVARSVSWPDHVLLLLMALPNLAWALLDRGIHAGDPGAHAYAAMRVYHALDAGAGEWWRELMAVAPKPPMAMWLAHLGAPLGKWLGHFDSGLLLATIAAGYVALLLLYKSLLIFFKDRAASLAGCLVVASAPLWLAYARGLWMQPLQLLSVCWFLWIMAAAPRLDRLAGLLHLAAASAFSLLVMASTPLYCLLPGAIALVCVLRAPWPAGAAWKRSLPLAAFTTLLAVLLFAWYLQNWNAAVEHTRWASGFSYNVSAQGIFPKLHYWLKALAAGTLLLPTLMTALAALGLAASARKGNARSLGRNWPAAIAVLQILLALAVLSLADNEEERYVIPLLAYAGLLIAWALGKLKWRWPAWAALAVLGAQFLLVQAEAFGMPLPGRRLFASAVLSRDHGRLGSVLEGVSAAVSSLPPGKVLLATQSLIHCGLMFGALDIQFHEAKKPGYDRAAARVYESVEFRLDKNGCDMGELWLHAQKPEVAGVVAVNEQNCSPDLAGERGYRPLFDAAREFSSRVRECGEFVRLSVAGLPEIDLFHRAEEANGEAGTNRRKGPNGLENKAK